jgi:hypothetical protein
VSLSFVFTDTTFSNGSKLCFVFSLAVEPFNPQPQLYHIAPSRSYQGSLSAWCSLLAGIFFLRGYGGMLVISPHLPASHFETHICCLKGAEVYDSLLTMGTFPTTLLSLVGNFWKRLDMNMAAFSQMRLKRSACRCESSCELLFFWFRSTSMAVNFHFVLIFHGAVISKASC